ncbi:GTP cyclohydrolase I FolE [Helicobacter jaachi]|uniref:GTP cyclohydrolase 1 n=1 Tax=Helicobacter jaachi TaxID=1677920 RepID=A0A4U8T6F7_9HELI|nr:GTP cyclohydrolase I FolE [Helicobacter jaachi]TLD95189.1 GTP cyclohydrolase I FolE [Helicobacter jaachi]
MSAQHHSNNHIDSIHADSVSTLIESSTEFFNILCQNIGENPTREGLLRTPERMAQSLCDMLNGYTISPKAALGSIFKDNVCDEMIILKKLPFYSICEHHLLPFFGTLSIAYIPNKSFVGISGLARLAEIFAHRLQIQEQLTAQIADSIMCELDPKGAIVVCEARHLCLEMRGNHKQSPIITSALRGNFKADSKTRAEFMQLIKD